LSSSESAGGGPLQADSECVQERRRSVLALGRRVVAVEAGNVRYEGVTMGGRTV
jgi:hypothetical protein